MSPSFLAVPRLRLPVIAASTLAVALALAGCAASLPSTVLVPTGENGAGVVTYFNQGEPFAVLRDSSGTVLAALEPAVLGTAAYLRLWYLAQNDDSPPFRIDPQSDFSLRLREKVSGAVQDIAPEEERTILERLDDVRPARATRHFERDVDARDRVGGKWMEYYWSDTHEWDERRTILHREDVLAGARVHGFAYFPVPMRFQAVAGDDEGWIRYAFDKGTANPDDDFDVEVRVTTPAGVRTLAFEPADSR